MLGGNTDTKSFHVVQYIKRMVSYFYVSRHSNFVASLGNLIYRWYCLNPLKSGIIYHAVDSEWMLIKKKFVWWRWFPDPSFIILSIFFSFFGGVASCSVLFSPFSGKKMPFPSDLNFLVKLLNWQCYCAERKGFLKCILIWLNSL